MLDESTIKKISARVAKAVMSMNYGTSRAVVCDRIALMKKSRSGEVYLGGCNRYCVETTVAHELRKLRIE